ncbi:MAG: dethiobiotin synthase [Chlorobi bacterium]|nr:dethiobiotin synthase [Chlorobiota bacterium]
MPRIFTPGNIDKEEKEIRKDYSDRHTPHVICDDQAKRGRKFRVKVRLGEQHPHPDDADHYIAYLQLWNRETLIAETRYQSGAFGNELSHPGVDFYIHPRISMNLSAMALCTKHGPWQSESIAVEVFD